METKKNNMRQLDILKNRNREKTESYRYLGQIAEVIGTSSQG